jgi:hypothetical protein
VTGFAELKKAESDALLQFLKLHIHSADDHYVRWKWEVGSVALWDNVSQSVLISSCHSPLVFFHEERSMIEGLMARDRTGIQRVGLRWDQRLICVYRESRFIVLFQGIIQQILVRESELLCLVRNVCLRSF